MEPNLDQILNEFDRIRCCSTLLEAYKNPTKRRVWVQIFKSVGLWKGSFRRITKQLRSKEYRRQYKRQWALDHKDSIRRSRAAYLQKKKTAANLKQATEVATVLMQ